MTVFADTSPINYLILIQSIGLFPQLFGHVVIPSEVLGELRHQGAPASTSLWAADPPAWLIIEEAEFGKHEVLSANLGAGERAAIALAVETPRSILLIDDQLGRREARRRQVAYIGTLGILELAASKHLIDLGTSISRLRLTNFHLSPGLLRFYLERATLIRKATE